MIEEFSLAGKTALLTGSSRGIGRGIVEVFVEARADVVVNALTATHLTPFVDELRAAHHDRRIVALPGDCSSPEGARALVAAANEALGRIDILVNGVGDSLPTRFGAADDDGQDADIAKVIDLNLMSAIHCSRAVAEQMLARRAGRIVNIAGLMGLRGTPRYAVYSAAKAGIAGLTRSMAREWATMGITVNAIAPGVIPDPHVQYDATFTAIIAEAAAEIPMQRIGTPREAGLLALYLASEAGAYMTGQTLSLDGGSSG